MRLRSSSLLRSAQTRPRLPSSRPAVSSTSYATVATRSSLRGASSVMSPSLFLLHVSSLSVASISIPLLVHRRHASSTATASPDPEPVPAPHEYPIQQPYPTKPQLLSLSRQLRNLAPADAAFTLRQLHLVNSVPRLVLPSTKAQLEQLLPERWIWRLPATAAIHSILRILEDPAHLDKHKLKLAPIAITIAQHALEFDAIMWTTILDAHDQAHAIEWERVSLDRRGQQGGRGLEESPTILTRLDTTERDERVRNEQSGTAQREEQHDAILRGLWGERFAKQASRKQTPLSSKLRHRRHAREPLDTDESSSTQLPSHLRSFSSIPAKTLDRLVVHLFKRHQSRHEQDPIESRETISSTLAVSLALSNVRIARSRIAIYESFVACLDHHRPDLAARFFVDYLDQVDREQSVEAGQAAQRMFRLRLSRALRPNEDRRFDPEPSRQVLAAVATLTRGLDQLWTKSLSSSSEKASRPTNPVLSDLLRFVVAFPVAPYPNDVRSDGTPEQDERRKLARAHARVYRMTKHVVRRILEDLTGHTIDLGKVKSRVKPHPFSTSTTRRVPRLGLIDFNTLIHYSLAKLQSPELALLVLEQMTRRSLKPTAATHNILFSVLYPAATKTRPAPQTPSYPTLLSDPHRPRDERTIPTLLKHMVETSSFDSLEETVFRILPELDHLNEPPSLQPHTPLTPRPPPREGRNPWLYTTLLYAISCTGKIGLAERVFRNARWAAERSREEEEPRSSDQDGVVQEPRKRGWVLPPAAFTIMLNMYANEVRRGHQLERQRIDSEFSSSTSNVHVKGWGRHALRLFLLRSSESTNTTAQNLIDPKRPTATPNRFGRTSKFRNTLRSEAGPIVALYELEGGTKHPQELKSLELAMRDPGTKSSLETLFPGNHISDAAFEHDDDGWTTRGQKTRKDEKQERNRIRSQTDRNRTRIRKLLMRHE
ncbi:uncharacterized protein JCM15063_006048 [Sporobolomyces koalae]|uniref:uncharacterized protein n=1 Tax=Sporobolomyces koalae TaxID=500713 RepID=UPI00316CB9A3